MAFCGSGPLGSSAATTSIGTSWETAAMLVLWDRCGPSPFFQLMMLRVLDATLAAVLGFLCFSVAAGGACQLKLDRKMYASGSRSARDKFYYPKKVCGKGLTVSSAFLIVGVSSSSCMRAGVRMDRCFNISAEDVGALVELAGVLGCWPESETLVAEIAPSVVPGLWPKTEAVEADDALSVVTGCWPGQLFEGVQSAEGTVNSLRCLATELEAVF